MAITTVISEKWFAGSKAYTRGTFTTAGGNTGGNMNVGLHKVDFISFTPDASTSPTEQCQVDETLPYDGSAITVVVTDGVDGYWMAFGDTHL